MTPEAKQFWTTWRLKPRRFPKLEDVPFHYIPEAPESIIREQGVWSIGEHDGDGWEIEFVWISARQRRRGFDWIRSRRPANPEGYWAVTVLEYRRDPSRVPGSYIYIGAIYQRITKRLYEARACLREWLRGYHD